MHYVVLDIHGCYDRYVAFLERIGFGDLDTLYVLKVLQDVVSRPNVVPLMGTMSMRRCAVCCG